MGRAAFRDLGKGNQHPFPFMLIASYDVIHNIVILILIDAHFDNKLASTSTEFNVTIIVIQTITLMF